MMSLTRLSWREDVLRQKPCFDNRKKRNASSAKPTKRRKMAERKRLEEEAWKKQKEEETWQREEDCQRDLAKRLEVDRITSIEQQWHKNWIKTFLLPSSSASNKEMNLINFPPLTKRQRIRYLPQETPEARQRCEELAREMGMSVVSGGSPCERCVDFGILCIP